MKPQGTTMGGGGRTGGGSWTGARSLYKVPSALDGKKLKLNSGRWPDRLSSLWPEDERPDGYLFGDLEAAQPIVPLRTPSYDC